MRDRRPREELLLGFVHEGTSIHGRSSASSSSCFMKCSQQGPGEEGLHGKESHRMSSIYLFMGDFERALFAFLS